MCRTLTLTGFLLLIDEAFEQARVLAALLVSITFLALHATVRPLKAQADRTLMTCSIFAGTRTAVFCMYRPIDQCSNLCVCS